MYIFPNVYNLYIIYYNFISVCLINNPFLSNFKVIKVNKDFLNKLKKDENIL